MVSPSGAFFSLRCLIYKVHAVPGGTLLLYSISFRLSRTFFQKFLTPGPSRIRSNLFRLPHFSLAVKSFFLSLSAAAHHRADSFVRIPNPPSLVNTFFPLFSFFLFRPLLLSLFYIIGKRSISRCNSRRFCMVYRTFFAFHSHIQLL